MSLDVLAQLCGEHARELSHETSNAGETAERRRGRPSKLTEKQIAAHSRSAGDDAGSTSCEDFDESSSDSRAGYYQTPSSSASDASGSRATSPGPTAAGGESGGEEGAKDGAGLDAQTRELKRQQRMIRNRQSAALSRKRKADRIEALVTQVTDLEKQTELLQRRLERSESLLSDSGIAPPDHLAAEAEEAAEFAEAAEAAEDVMPPISSEDTAGPEALGCEEPPSKKIAHETSLMGDMGQEKVRKPEYALSSSGV